MKKLLFLAVALCLFSVAAFAQKSANFSGTWVLDASKSRPAETGIESQTLVVTQTASDIKVERTTAVKAGAPGAGRGGMGGGSDAATYTLDGRAVKSELQRGNTTIPVTTTSKISDKGLSITRSMETPMGARESSEKWWMNADGTLTIEATRPNRDGGTDTVTRTYTKKS